MDKYRQVGGQLGAYIRANDPSTQQIQGFLGDLLVDDELLNPVRDAVSRPSFRGLQALAGSGAGGVQRDALLQELGRSYLPNVVAGVGQVINGLLDQPRSTQFSREKYQAQVEPIGSTDNRRLVTGEGSSSKKSLPRPIDFFAKKFDPRRPMGRRNYFITYLLCVAAVFLATFLIALGVPGFDETPMPPLNVVVFAGILWPVWLLHFRRARGAGIHFAYIYVLILLTPINLMTERGAVEAAINIYQFIVTLNLLFKKDVLEPALP